MSFAGGGYDNGEWPTPERTEKVTEKSITWGPDYFSKKNKNKELHELTPASNPRKDLKNNRCELFLSDIGAELVQSEKKTKLAEAKFFLLAELTEETMNGNKRALDSNFTKTQEDFRISGVKGKDSDRGTWSLNIESTVNTILGKELVSASETMEEDDTGDTGTSDSDDTASNAVDSNDSAAGDGTKIVDNAKDLVNDDCRCPEPEVNPIQNSKPTMCSSLTKEDSSYARYKTTIKRTKEWISTLQLPLKWKESNEDGYFQIQKIENTIEDCTQLMVILSAFGKTAGCKPQMETTQKCWTDIQGFVEERK